MGESKQRVSAKWTDETDQIFKYDNLFRDSIATGERARASTQRSGIGISLNDDLNLYENPEHDNAEGSGDSDEIHGAHNASGRNNMFLPSSFQAGTSSGSKRKRSSTSSIKDGIQSLLNLALTKSTETVSYAPPEGPTIEECMTLLNGLEGVPKYSSFYYFPQSLFEKSGNRKIFMAQPDDRARVGWLDFKYMDYMK